MMAALFGSGNEHVAPHFDAAVPEAPNQPASDSASHPPASVAGNGFFVSEAGDILTTNDVAANCQNPAIPREGKQAISGRVIAKDSLNDLALIRVEDRPAALPTWRIGAPVGENIGIYGPSEDTEGAVIASAGLEGDTRMLQISAQVQNEAGAPILDESGSCGRD